MPAEVGAGRPAPTRAAAGRREVVLAGEGGQGLVVAGIILGEAAIAEGLEATQSQWVLGSAARGSLSRSEVVISGREIAFPRVRRAGVLLALTPEALRRHLPMTAPDALIILDSDHVPEAAGVGAEHRVVRLPILAVAARRGLGRSANILALGAVVGLAGLVRPESVEEALVRRFGAKAGPNLEAFRAGVGLAAGPAAPQDAARGPAARGLSEGPAPRNGGRGA